MVVSIPFLEARIRIWYREVLCYYKLHILKLWCYLRKRLTFQGQFFWNFFFSYQTKHCYFNYSFQEKYQSNRELFTKTHFRTKCESAKSIFRGKTPWSLDFSRVNISWFQLHMVIFAICLRIALDCEWGKRKKENGPLAKVHEKPGERFI